MPGKLLSKLDPTAVERLAARLPEGSALISATNGKTTTAAMTAEILRPRYALAHNASGANLMSGVVSTLLAVSDAELGLFEVDEAALPEVSRRIRPRALCLGNLFRDQLDRYGELELVAERWREAVGALPAGTALAVNGDDPQVGELARAHPGAVVFGLDDPRLARPSLQHAADSKYCVLCGTPYEYAAAYVGHLGDYRCPACGHARPALDVVARDIELAGLEHASFSLETPEGTRRVRLRVPGLYNVYNARRRGDARARSRHGARRRGRRPRALRRGVRAVRAHRDRRPARPLALDQEPGRRERGDSHARRRPSAHGSP